MSTQIKVPALGESVTEATVAKWIKKPGDSVLLDEPVVELETDKVTLEVGSPAAGVLKSIEVQQGVNVSVGALLGTVEAGAVAAKTEAAPSSGKTAEPLAAKAAVASEMPLAPSVKKLVAENALVPQNIAASGKDGRLTKGDVLSHLKGGSSSGVSRHEERVPMSRLRKKIAERLKSAQDTAAILTTFNEVDMSTVMDVRNRLKDRFEKRHQVKLGFMSFFVKACTTALKELPAVNARIDGDDIVYHNYCDVGVAVGTAQGLVVPVVRDADKMSFAQIESAIAEYGKKAKEGKLSIEDMTGGTFTISNGGVYGSLMSTPILNPPQSGILGMHKIQERPMVHNSQIVIRPMMYLALSYDHRIIDGKEAVTFLVRVKECLEDPERMLLEA
ncbi:MAG: 2-oxoglutarate dehydrogenase complex dihydrolipoyllysine-residue succinyltransferase [Alphaproteobacteria bacterium]|nr:2-oxoglutarate dehydrogenase complex dihydrolipoyllysine-residue succinyltransferase [Alphaproteobacteria bacterium]OJV46587.1 MAG: dihydrolipoamide succinyltransferase [Alphaproteobacteria bacterium 43-37]